MCNIFEDKIRINKILVEIAKTHVVRAPAGGEELIDLCVGALRDAYGDLCPEEVFEEKARGFLASLRGQTTWAWEASRRPGLLQSHLFQS